MLSPSIPAPIKLFAAIAASAMLPSSPAAADCQYTQWGDAPEAVENATVWLARANDDRGKDPPRN
ncbi:hypothetical protein [Paracoccus sanguinis]|uniref:hypothetical protein n=1 Tax=Paracoccus sanguinis TaxID=1545044 RepID=UPI0012E01C71|nr:hypothetical protein [Paracoccus sanguinis]